MCWKRWKHLITKPGWYAHNHLGEVTVRYYVSEDIKKVRLIYGNTYYGPLNIPVKDYFVKERP